MDKTASHLRKAVVLDNKVELLDTEVPFTAKPITESNNIASLCAAHHNQLFTIKGKLIQIIGTKKLADGVKEKADCYIGDPSGTIKVTLWENFTTSIQDGKTYTFSKVRVLKEHKSETLMLGTSLHDCNMSESPEFAQSSCHYVPF